LSGVQYLHSKGIIHRDIKGANILVDASCGVAKLADFGCSKQLLGIFTGSIEESMKAIRGSVPWMAPEVIKQSGHGRPADIWSVGATMIEMATGKPPWPEFSNNNFATLFHVATSTTPPPIPMELSSDCRHCISMCMMIDPSERLTAQQLVDDCEFISDELKSNGSKASANATAALVIANEQLKKFDTSEQI
jgi:mitogen-activated protein kinase kinase kinase